MFLLYRNLAEELEEPRNLGALSGADFSLQLSIKGNFKPEMLEKQYNKQLQTLHLDAPTVNILYALSQHIHTHTHVFC